MRISIQNNNKDIIEFDQLTVNGREAAGGYAFSFTLRGSRQACNEPLSIFDVSLSLSLSDPARPLCTAVPAFNQLIQCTNYANSSEQLNFECVLSRDQINALEENRQQGDLKLSIGLRALISGNNGLESSFDSAEFVIPREQWLQALRNSGFRQTMLFEIPLPAVSYELQDHLNKAQQFIETGHYQDAVMQCRRIVECLEQLRDDKRIASDANKKAHGAERQKMTAIERLMSLREQLKNVCQLGAHGNDQFSRSQARAVLGMTMLLLAEPTVGMSPANSAEILVSE